MQRYIYTQTIRFEHNTMGIIFPQIATLTNREFGIFRLLVIFSFHIQFSSVRKKSTHNNNNENIYQQTPIIIFLFLI